MAKKVRHIPAEITDALKRGAEGNSIVLDWLGGFAEKNATCGKIMYYISKVFACLNTADQITRSTINDLLTTTVLLQPANDALISGLLERGADAFAMKDGAQSLISVLVATANKGGMDALMRNGLTLASTDKAGKALEAYITESTNPEVQAWVTEYKATAEQAATAAREAEEARLAAEAKLAEEKAAADALAKVPAPVAARLKLLEAEKAALTEKLALLTPSAPAVDSRPSASMV